MDETVEPNPEHPLSFRRTMEKEALAIPGISTVVLRPGFMYGNDGYNSVSTDWFLMGEAGEAVFRGDRERGAGPGSISTILPKPICLRSRRTIASLPARCFILR